MKTFYTCNKYCSKNKNKKFKIIIYYICFKFFLKKNKKLFGSKTFSQL